MRAGALSRLSSAAVDASVGLVVMVESVDDLFGWGHGRPRSPALPLDMNSTMTARRGGNKLVDRVEMPSLHSLY